MFNMANNLHVQHGLHVDAACGLHVVHSTRRISENHLLLRRGISRPRHVSFIIPSHHETSGARSIKHLDGRKGKDLCSKFMAE